MISVDIIWFPPGLVTFIWRLCNVMQGEYKKSLYCNRSVLFWTVFDSSTYSQQRTQYKAKFDSKIQ
eukprot:SAG22_NODE_142_length_17922_cov_10.990406_14_plen_66_part_00